MLSGRVVGRIDRSQITVFAPVGLPWKDLALAWSLYQARPKPPTLVSRSICSPDRHVSYPRTARSARSTGRRSRPTVVRRLGVPVEEADGLRGCCVGDLGEQSGCCDLVIDHHPAVAKPSSPSVTSAGSAHPSRRQPR